jgi:sugar/nucleoside kinase (ribokinase family)
MHARQNDAMTDELDVLVVGGVGVDTIVAVPRLDMPVADSHMVPMVQARVGHTGDGVALGCHALGLRTHLVDLIGDDVEGRMVREHHAAAGLSFAWAKTSAGTKRAVNLVDPSGSRMSFYDARASSDDRLPETLWRSALSRTRNVHVSITYPSEFVIAAIAPGGPTVSTDLHNWDGVNSYHERFAYAADIVFLSATALSDPAATMRQILARGRASTVIATAGVDGCYVLARDESSVRHYPVAPLPGPPVDSNGAGDAFVSGFLYGDLSGLPLDECVRLGAIAGAHACTVLATESRPITRDAMLERAAKS